MSNKPSLSSGIPDQTNTSLVRRRAKKYQRNIRDKSTLMHPLQTLEIQCSSSTIEEFIAKWTTCNCRERLANMGVHYSKCGTDKDSSLFLWTYYRGVK